MTALPVLVLSGTMACSGLDTIGGIEREIPDDVPRVTPKEEPPLVDATAKPPAVSGGTLLVTRDDAWVVAADPDRDSVWIVDTVQNTLRFRVRLAIGTEPGRLVEDQDGKVHVALRRGGQLVKIDPQSGTVVSMRNVCAAPRGMAYDVATDNLHVACAGGEFVTLKARGGDPVRTLILDRDLRDVAMKGDHVFVSRFRSAELIEIDAAGAVLGRVSPRNIANSGMSMPPLPPTTPTSAAPTTAWRMVSLSSGSVVMLHQRSQTTPVSITRPGGYGPGPGPCPCPCGIVSTGLTIFSDAAHGASGIGLGSVVSGTTLAVDVAVSRDGEKLALIGPSARSGIFGSVPIVTQAKLSATDACAPASESLGLNKPAEPIAGAFDSMTRLWVQSRSPAQLHRLAAGSSVVTIGLDGAEDRADEGHRIFHTVTTGNIACASCHAEAGDDSHIWNFEPIGPRRTQSLRGGLFATAPFHWDGDMGDLNSLMNDVFVRRMSGPSVNSDQVRSVGRWLDAQPTLPKSPPADPQIVLRGQKLFEDSALGCQGCHSGPLHTNNASVDVGTGKAFQVPPLRDLATRAPFIHTGCAKTLRARFDPSCGGGDRHGKTSHLSSTELDELVAYLETL